MTSRPTKNDPEFLNIVCKKVLDLLLKWSDNKNQEDWEDIAKFVVQHAIYGENGYEICRAIEETFSVYGIDAELVDILDNIHFTINEELDKFIEEWVKKEDIKCPFVMDQKVYFYDGNQKYFGTITKINEKKAKITVFCQELGHGKKDSNGMTRTGRVFNYEECESDPDWKPGMIRKTDHFICPICQEKAVTTCRCFRGDSTCKNGHSWHRCTVHHVTVIGDSDHSIDTMKCTCGRG